MFTALCRNIRAILFSHINDSPDFIPNQAIRGADGTSGRQPDYRELDVNLGTLTKDTLNDITDRTNTP